MLLTGVAAAHPPPELPTTSRPTGAAIARSPSGRRWIRLGYGVASEPRNVAARTIGEPQTYETAGHVDAALGADVTLPLPTSKVRMGPWIELRPDDAVGGVEVSIAGKSLDMFWYEGERVITARAARHVPRHRRTRVRLSLPVEAVGSVQQDESLHDRRAARRVGLAGDGESE